MPSAMKSVAMNTPMQYTMAQIFEMMRGAVDLERKQIATAMRELAWSGEYFGEDTPILALDLLVNGLNTWANELTQNIRD